MGSIGFIVEAVSWGVLGAEYPKGPCAQIVHTLG